MDYIRQAGGSGGSAPCVFCIRDGDLDDPERLLVGLYPGTVAILNRYPYNNGHVLVAPRRHVADLWDLSSEELRELFSLVSLGSRALAREYRTEGLNVGMNLGKAAGAGFSLGCRGRTPRNETTSSHPGQPHPLGPGLVRPLPGISHPFGAPG